MNIFFAYYSKVYILKDFLKENLTFCLYEKIMRLGVDILEKTIIASNNFVSPYITCYDCKMNLKDVISHTVYELLLVRNNKKFNRSTNVPPNVITYGARISSINNIKTSSDLIEYCFPNSAVNRLKSSQWEKISHMYNLIFLEWETI